MVRVYVCVCLCVSVRVRGLCSLMSSYTYGSNTCLDIAFFCSFVQRPFRHFVDWSARRYRRAKILHMRDMQVWQSHVHVPKNDHISMSSKINLSFFEPIGFRMQAKLFLFTLNFV